MNKTAIITGISGQDGAYLAKFLLEKGYNIVGVTRDRLMMEEKSLSYLQILNEVEFVEMQHLDEQRTQRLLLKFKPDEIYNLASQSSVGNSFHDPYNTLNYNIVSVLYWLESIKKLNSGIKYYQASSSEMFGNVPVQDLPLKESLIFHPASPYGVSKAAAHWLSVNYRESNGIFSACGILFNHESALRGNNFVVKKIINTAVKMKMGLHDGKLFLGNTEIRRDWGYAPEYIKAMWLMMQQSCPDDYIICSGNEMSLHNVVEYVFKCLNLNAEECIVKDTSLLRPNDLAVIYGDNSKAKRELGWQYNISNEQLLETLINDERDYIEWEFKNVVK